MLKPISHAFEFRVSYADTDRMNVVYYSNYLMLFERGRTELMRDLGLCYKDLEEKEKVFLPALEARCRYSAPARYDDLLRIVTRVKELGRAYIDFEYEVFNKETNQKLVEGYTRHPFVNERWKPVRVPAFIREKLESK